MSVWNFSAGPAHLPPPVIEAARNDLVDWQGTGLGIAELSHRSPAFMARAESITANVRMLLDVPSSHAMLFMAGGATTQQALVALNFAHAGQPADYLVTGHWSRVAVRQAQGVDACIAASSESDGFTHVPPVHTWAHSHDSAYLHLTANETIHGVELPALMPQAQAPLVVDASSNIASRTMDVAACGMVYAGAQKNLGAAGITLVIIRRDLLERVGQPRAPIFDYRAHAAAGSMLNTPPVWNWHVLGLTVEWMLAQGGTAHFAQLNAAKAALVYDCIDASNGFYRNAVAPAVRSRMNIPFALPTARLDALFVEEASAEGLLGLKGHKAVGGIRASLYNAMPLAGAHALVGFMQHFQQRHG